MKDDIVYNNSDNRVFVKTDGKDKKWILTFRVLDNYEIKPELN